MTLTQYATSIFIFEGSPVTAESQKCLLETHNHSVTIINPDSIFEHEDMGDKDIVMLDVDVENPLGFPVLDRFMKAKLRPKLLITTYDGQVFKGDDFIDGGGAHILFKPFSPDDLLEAINALSQSSYD